MIDSYYFSVEGFAHLDCNDANPFISYEYNWKSTSISWNKSGVNIKKMHYYVFISKEEDSSPRGFWRLEEIF